MNGLLHGAYGVAWTVARPLAALLPGDGKLARAARGRAGGARALVQWARAHRTREPLVWFHAASVGEGRQAEAVLRRLRSARPGWQIVYTFASATAERFAASLPADAAGFVPADTPGETAAALEALRPSALVFSATDLWPELVRQAARRGVRTAIISATLAPTSSRRGTLARALLAPAYAALDRAGAIDPADAEGLAALGVRPEAIVLTGDTRHDAAHARATALDRGGAAFRTVSREGPPVLVAGSTWPADERALLDGIGRVRRDAPLRLAIAPHEPTPSHLAALERRVTASWPGARAARLSLLEAQAGDWDVCLVDRLGVLADLYAGARIAFVGGGFHGAGLHAVIEPAAHGVPVLFGPAWRSSRDARLLLEAGGARSAADATGLASCLREWLANDEARTAAGAAARAVVHRGLGAAERSLELVLQLVEGA